MRFRLLRVLLLFLCAMTAAVRGYVLTGWHWTSPTTTMQLQLGANSGTLIDGLTSWNAVAEDALTIWNNNISALHFNVVRDSTAARAEGNRINNVFFSADIYGEAWGSGVLAVTLTYAARNATSETDVLFNNRLSWNSYRGALRYSNTGVPIYDFHRVALHEFGHVLGLDHPDENGQIVSALMNSRVSSIDAPTTDDLNGAHVLYGTPATAPAALAPTITVQPTSVAVTVGQSASLSVTASGTGTLVYQWLKGGTVVTGATAARLSFAAATASDAGAYAVVVANGVGSIMSSSVTLTVNPAPAPPPVITTPPATSTPVPPSTSTPAATAAPTITATPVAQTVASGERATLSVVATGTGPFSYQWLKDGAEISGATSATLALDAARPTDTGVYSVRVSNAAGSTTTAGATLTVKFSRLVNLSTRGFVPPGGALTPGFFVRGTKTKPLLIRAVGPTLSLFGVGSALAEAKLDVIAQSSSAVVVSNNAWGGSALLREGFASVGAFPLAADSKDAAVETNLSPAAYTVRVTTGDAISSGVTLAEIYDAEPVTATGAQLVNVSTLGFVGSGDKILTAGFAIAGNAPKRLLIRAVGPGLAPFGVTGLLPNPQLGLVPLGGTEPLATNDDWPDLVNVRAAFTSAGAFALTPGSKDAALVITLEPGAYTVIVSDVSGSASGNALVEIYDLDP